LFENGNKYSGLWVEGKYDGHGEYFISQNRDKYAGEFSKNKYEGFGIYYFSNGAKYVGYWKDGKQHGFGTDYNSTGGIINQGIYDNGAFVKSKEMYTMDCTFQERPYITGSFDDRGINEVAIQQCGLFKKYLNGLENLFDGLYEANDYESYRSNNLNYSWKAIDTLPKFDYGTIEWSSHNNYRASFIKCDVIGLDFYTDVIKLIKGCIGDGWTECKEFPQTSDLMYYYQLKKGDKYVSLEYTSYIDEYGESNCVYLTFELDIRPDRVD
jgi:hypothetical protein